MAKYNVLITAKAGDGKFTLSLKSNEDGSDYYDQPNIWYNEQVIAVLPKFMEAMEATGIRWEKNSRAGTFAANDLTRKQYLSFQRAVLLFFLGKNDEEVAKLAGNE